MTYCPEEKLSLAYATNAKIDPVRNIVNGVFDVYWNRPFEVPTLDAFNVSPDVLDRYVGVGLMTITRGKEQRVFTKEK